MIIVGAVMLIWTGFSFTREETVVDIGALELTADKQETVNWPPYVGGIILVAGFIVLLTAKRPARDV